MYCLLFEYFLLWQYSQKLDVLKHQIRHIRSFLTDVNFESQYKARKAATGSTSKHDALRRASEHFENFQTRKDRIAVGTLNDVEVEAFADTCAGGNFVSVAHLRKHALSFDKKLRRKIKRADGSLYATLGTALLSWQFSDKSMSQMVKFDVLPEGYCGHAVTLGGKFLSMTNTLTKFAHRIIRKIRPTLTRRVLFQGGSQLRMMGYCSGVRVAALPDTGSDANLVSPEMADELAGYGLDISNDEEHQVCLELPGGRMVRTSGIVRNVEFRFGDGRMEDSFTRDFHILSGLPARVLLSDDFLDDTNAFQTYSEHMIEYKDDEEFDIPEGLFLNIKWVEHMSSVFRKSKAKGKNTPLQQAHIDWSNNQINILNEMQAVHESTTMSEEQKTIAILELEERYRQLQRDKPNKSSPIAKPPPPPPPPPALSSNGPPASSNP